MGLKSNISDSIKEVYFGLEQKWYDVLERINDYVPILKVTDKIDAVVPSFALFLIFLAILLLSLLAFVLLPMFGPQSELYDAQVTVFSSSGLALFGAKVEAKMICSGEEVIQEATSDSSGVAVFEACSKTVLLSITKKLYLPLDKNISFDETLSAKVFLSSAPLPEKKLFIQVTDIDKALVKGASLELTCLTDSNKFYYKDQPEKGFDVVIKSGCVNLQAKAFASGYDEKTITLNPTDQRLSIALEKTITEGTVIFSAESKSKAQSEIEIVLTSALTKKSLTLYTDKSGVATEKINAGEYSFVAISKISGEMQKGSFEILAKEIKDIRVEFEVDATKPVDHSNNKYIWVKILDGNTPVAGAKVKLFSDANTISPDLSTSGSGEIQKRTILEKSIDFSTTLRALIKKPGYKTAVVLVNLLDSNSNPQEVQLNQGGSEIDISVIDDAYEKVSEARVMLYIPGIPFEIENDVSDRNGKAIFKSLPESSYTIKASSKDSEGEANTSLGSNSKLDINVMIILGTGTYKFKFYSQKGDSVSPALELYTREFGGQFIKAESALAKSGMYTTKTLKVNTELMLLINDSNFFSYETTVFRIKRGNQQREIYLIPTQLPNARVPQIFLNQVYKSNPLSTQAAVADTLLPNNEYFLLFTFVANKEESLDLLSNFYIGNALKKTLDINDNISINSVQSISGAINLLSSNMDSMRISIDSNSLVSSLAKQANVSIATLQGPKSIPIVVSIKVDANAIGPAKISWQGLFGDDNSLLYSKDFNIGQEFCLRDCPVFLFSNYIKWNQRAYVPMGEEPYRVLIGDDYKVKVIVSNTTDEAIGLSDLLLFVKAEVYDRLAFDTDKNSSSMQINLGPLSDALPKEFSLMLKTASSSAKAYESVEQMKDGQDRLKWYAGNSAPFRLWIAKKDQLQIIVAPESMQANSENPFVYIKTKYTSGNNRVTAHWKAETILSGGEKELVSEGTTDQNGIQLTSLSFLNYSAGTDVLFTTWDDEGALPGTLTIKLSKLAPSLPVAETECLSIKIAGVDISTQANPRLNIENDATKTFTIESSCPSARNISVQSDGAIVSPMTATIPADSSIEISVLANARLVAPENYPMLGAYPISVTDSNNAKRVASFDIVISDPSSCFELTEAIYDLRTNTLLPGKIINKCFEGRYDNFYPKMDISTGSVSLQYKKPGNPKKIDFNVTVIGSALEGFWQSTIGSSIFHHKSDGDGGDAEAQPVPGSKAEELNCFSDFEDTANTFEYNGESIEKPEPDLNITNPDLPLYRLPIPSDWETSDTSADSGEMSSKENINAKAKKASFQATTLTTQVDSGGWPITPSVGLYGEFVAGTAELPSTYETTSGAYTYNDANTCPSTSSAGDSGAPCKNMLYPWDQYIEYLGWPVFLWNNEDTERISASGSIGLSLDPNVMSKSGTHIGTVWKGSDGKWYDLASPQRWYRNSPLWLGITEKGDMCYVVLGTSGCEDCQLVEAGYLGGGLHYFKTSADGDTDCSLFGCDDEPADLYIQFELMRGGEIIHERRGYFDKNVSINAEEGVVHDLGSYGEASPIPQWTEVDESSDGYASGEGKAFPYSYYTMGPMYSNGFVNPEHAAVDYTQGCVVGDTTCESKVNWTIDDIENCRNSTETNCGWMKWVIRPAADPLVEYDGTGNAMYYIPTDTIPVNNEGKQYLRMFLKNGHVYAEYIGLPEIDSNTIDFNVSKNNLLGQEYAAVTVADWIMDENGVLVKSERVFQVKLVGQPSLCYAADGTAGATGEEFVPKVLFNWNWQQIDDEACDSQNDQAVYCDAAQFTVTLFKKLALMQRYLIANKPNEVAELSVYNAMLIADNYSQDFLTSFDEYYSQELANADSYFNTVGTIRGFDQFITSNRLKFQLRKDGASETQLPYGGLYRVEIGLELDNPDYLNLFDNNAPNATITVTLAPIRKAPNYTPLYETPFDGEIGTNGTNFARTGFGASISGGELKLNSTTKAHSYSGATTTIDYDSSQALDDLASGIVLTYDTASKRMIFNPSNPSPMIMNVKSADGKAKASYSLINLSQQSQPIVQAPNKEWYMLGSTMGGRECIDFSGESIRRFIESETENGVKSMSWTGTEAGTINLATTFFAPKVASSMIAAARIADEQNNSLDSYAKLRNPNRPHTTSLVLNNFDAEKIDPDDYPRVEDYDTLQFVLDSVREETMCISQSSDKSLKVWWNEEHLLEMIDDVTSGSSYGCD
ncbi:MAG: hypothetical protein AABW59_01295 [archaeon]